jgi:hypothetical protein
MITKVNPLVTMDRERPRHSGPQRGGISAGRRAVHTRLFANECRNSRRFLAINLSNLGLKSPQRPKPDDVALNILLDRRARARVCCCPPSGSLASVSRVAAVPHLPFCTEDSGPGRRQSNKRWIAALAPR